MTEVQAARLISRFFLLVYLDETMAREASVKALNHWRQAFSRTANTLLNGQILLARSLVEIWSGLSGPPTTGQPIVFAKEKWSVPSELDLGVWLDFRKSSEPNEFLALSLVKALGLPLESVAEGLRVTHGTIEHRLTRALKKLGRLQLGNAIAP